MTVHQSSDSPSVSDKDLNSASDVCEEHGEDSPGSQRTTAALQSKLRKRNAECTDLERENKCLKADLAKAQSSAGPSTAVKALDPTAARAKATQLKASIEKMLHSQMAYKKSLKTKQGAYKAEMPNVEEAVARAFMGSLWKGTGKGKTVKATEPMNLNVKSKSLRYGSNLSPAGGFVVTWVRESQMLRVTGKYGMV